MWAKPHRRAISVTAQSVAVRRSAAICRRYFFTYWMGVVPSTPRKQRRHSLSLMLAWAARVRAVISEA